MHTVAETAPSTLAGLATAGFTLLTAIVVSIGTVISFLANRRVKEKVQEVNVKVEGVDARVEGVHQIVNSRFTGLLERQERLISALEKAGIPIPQAAPEAGDN